MNEKIVPMIPATPPGWETVLGHKAVKAEQCLKMDPAAQNAAAPMLTLYAETLSRTALHESSHAICDFILGVRVTRLTIVPLPGCYRGSCDVIFPPRHQVPPAQWEWHQRRTIISLLAGPLSGMGPFEDEIKPLDWGGANDARKVVNLVQALYPEAAHEDRQRFLGNMCLVSRSLILDPVAWRAIESLTSALLVYKTLTWKMLDALFYAALPAADRTRLADLTARKINALKAMMELPALGTKEAA